MAESLVAPSSASQLRASARALVARSCVVDAELLVVLGDIDERRLFLDWGFGSMFAFCVEELGLSEDAAYMRILVARAARRMPALLEALRAGRVHLAGLRLLAPHLHDENCEAVLAEAAGKSRRSIEELVARLAPKPPVPELLRQIPPRTPAPGAATPTSAGIAALPVMPDAPRDLIAPPAAPARSVVAPLAEDSFKVQFTITRAVRDKLREAQALVWHRVPDGGLAAVFELALDALIEKTRRERFALTKRKPRAGVASAGNAASAVDSRPAGFDPASRSTGAASRHVPNAVRRTVFERDEGRCTFTSPDGRRCAETRALELDHIDGFARVHEHRADRMRLLCRPHNQHAAVELYGVEVVERGRAAHEERRRQSAAADDACAEPTEVIHRELVPGQVHEPSG